MQLLNPFTAEERPHMKHAYELKVRTAKFGVSTLKEYVMIFTPKLFLNESLKDWPSGARASGVEKITSLQPLYQYWPCISWVHIYS